MIRGQNTSMVYAVSNISSIFRWLIKGFSERSPVNPQSSQRPIHGSRQTKGASAEADRCQNSGIPHSAFPGKECHLEEQFRLFDLIIKYQCVMVKHVIINLAGTIFQLQDSFFICFGSTGFWIQQKIGKAVLPIEGETVITSFGNQAELEH